MALTREQVIAAFWEAIELDLKDLPPEEEIDYTFSPEYCKKRDALIAEERRGSFRLMTRSKRKMLIVAAALITAFILVGCTPRLREAVVDFVVEIYETFVRCRPEETLKKEIETIYELSWLPEGYIESDRKNYGDIRVETFYKNQQGNEIVFRQHKGKDALNSTDNEQGQIHLTTDTGTEVILYIGKEINKVVWSFNGYYFTATCNTAIEVSDMEKMVSSIVPMS